MLLGDLQSLDSVGRNQYPIASGLQSVAEQFAEGAFVFHHEKRRRSGWKRCQLWGLWGKIFHRPVDLWEIDSEGCAFPQFAVGEHVPATLLHNPVDRSQSQARAFPRFLCGEERFK